MIASRRMLSHSREVSGQRSGCEAPRLIRGSELQQDEALRFGKSAGQNTKNKDLTPKPAGEAQG